MRIVSMVILLALSGCSGQIQWGVPTEQKIQAQLAPVMQALEQHATAINNQAAAIQKISPKKED